ncbi:hypothetical protein NQD34_000679 [Periophthalmus magnuspinnatus]|nr:hypothetical protein NQD34_000679 [Periophthalmus magnuspinnatus]
MHTSASLPQSHRPDHCALDSHRECVSLLPRVCELLAASGSCLPDDTSLEKLLDWFTQLSQNGTSLHENFPCLLEFISTVTHNTASDPAVICFMIKLTGVMASTVEGFQILQERLTVDEVFKVQRWQGAGLWEDPSVRSGWIHGLRNMMQHPGALSFFIQSEMMGHLFLLQTDSSLFVASSANQLLAHILLFYQPESPLTDSKDHSYKETHLKQNDSEPSSLLISTSYNTVVMSTCDYLKQSLLPKEQKQLQQSARLLRLITQILSQAGAPLWDKVSEAVSGPLKDLVTTENSQLTVPLMEVILAANCSSSPGGQSASGLLCAMLEVRDPTERIRAAAALLHKGLCDPVHTSKAVKILLLPLDILTGHSVLCSDAVGEIKEELQINKSSCTSLICMCVANLHQITLLPANLLPCPPAGIVSTLVSLLHMSLDATDWPGCVEVIKYIFENGKFQKCALDALIAVSQCSGARDKVIEVFTVVLLYLDHPHCEPIVLHKCYQAVLKWTSVCTDLSWMSYQLRQDLLRVVQKRVCDLRWEVRDSTVEFLGQQAALAPSSSIPSQSLLLLDECSTLPLLREALQDQENYVRASAVSALAQALQRGWSQGAVESTEQTDIVTKLLSILCEDTEGFSRRAVVQYFISWFSSSSSSPSLLMSSIPSILSHGSSDLDWEVKVHTLELATLLMDSTLAGHLTQPWHPYAAAISQPTYNFSSQNSETNVEDSLSKLVEQGVISTLFSGFYDCDRPVGLKACQLLISLQETLKKSECTVKCSLPSWGWGQEIRALMGNLNGSDLVNVQEVLRCLNLEQRLCVLSQSSDHVQNSPLSLLQDILTARDVHSHAVQQRDRRS